MGVLTIFIAGMVCQRFYDVRNMISLLQIKQDYKLPPPDLQGAEIHIFLLAGQSNMEGVGDVEDYVPPPRHLSDRIFVFGKNYQLAIGREPVAKSGVGPSVAFAATYLEEIGCPNVSVALVPATRGGTNIGQWAPSLNDGALYTEAVKRTLAASHLGRIRGVLFFQGEGDTDGDPEDHPDDWDAQFENLVQNLRDDFGTEDLPVVFAQLGAGQHTDWQKVKDAQIRVSLQNGSMITTDDLPYGVGVHFTTSSYVEIGRRFAKAMVRLQRQSGYLCGGDNLSR